MPTTARYLELFHLTFLTYLRPKPGRCEFILKGGGNLRYFYRSIRYSQDIDMDVQGSIEDVQAAVDRSLASRPLQATLAMGGVTVKSCTAAKQTETTQRWTIQLDIQLGVASGRDPQPTKIEFSARPEMYDYTGETRTDFVDDAVTRPYGISPPRVTYYLPAPAVIQKVRTLGERSKVQSRDIFDLELLFRAHPDVDVGGRLTENQVHAAINRIYEVPYEAYRNQVVAYLEDDYIEERDDPLRWEHTQTFVIGHLEALL